MTTLLKSLGVVFVFVLVLFSYRTLSSRFFQNHQSQLPSKTDLIATKPPKSLSTPTTKPAPPITNAATQTVISKKPAGIYCLLNGDTIQNPILPSRLTTLQSWTDTNIDGVAVRSWWNKIETSEGTRDWAYIDEAVRLAEQNHKQISISVMAGINTPEWVYTKGAKKFTLSVPSLQSGQSETIQSMPFPWDTSFLSSWGSFVNALGARYDGKPVVSYVYINGAGVASETYFVKSASDFAAFNAAGGIAKWIEGTEKIIDLYATAFPHTPVVIALASPVSGADGGDTAMKTIIDYGTSKYPGHFGITNHGLSARSSSVSLPNQLIQSHSSDSPVGFQMVWSTAGANASQIGGTLEQALEKASLLKAHFVEVYLSDCTNASYGTTLKTYGIAYKQNF